MSVNDFSMDGKRIQQNVSDITHFSKPENKQRLLENAYNVKLSSTDNESKDWTSPNGTVLTRRKASTDIDSKISEILNKRDFFEGRPFHPLGLHRRRLSNKV
jgi:hypothetical protein